MLLCVHTCPEIGKPVKASAGRCSYGNAPAHASHRSYKPSTTCSLAVHTPPYGMGRHERRHDQPESMPESYMCKGGCSRHSPVALTLNQTHRAHGKRAHQDRLLASRQQELAVQGEAKCAHSVRMPVHCGVHHAFGSLSHLCFARPRPRAAVSMQSVSAEVVPALPLGVITSGAWSRDVRHGPDIWGKASDLYICAEAEAWSGSCHALSTACSMRCRSHHMPHHQNSSTACCSTFAGVWPMPSYVCQHRRQAHLSTSLCMLRSWCQILMRPVTSPAATRSAWGSSATHCAGQV